MSIIIITPDREEEVLITSKGGKTIICLTEE